jgi:hypothetical protein
MIAAFHKDIYLVAAIIGYFLEKIECISCYRIMNWPYKINRPIISLLLKKRELFCS